MFKYICRLFGFNICQTTNTNVVEPPIPNSNSADVANVDVEQPTLVLVSLSQVLQLEQCIIELGTCFLEGTIIDIQKVESIIIQLCKVTFTFISTTRISCVIQPSKHDPDFIRIPFNLTMQLKDSIEELCKCFLEGTIIRIKKIEYLVEQLFVTFIEFHSSHRIYNLAQLH